MNLSQVVSQLIVLHSAGGRFSVAGDVLSLYTNPGLLAEN